MYDENDLYNEVTGTVKNTGRDIFDIVDRVNRLMNGNGAISTPAKPVETSPSFIFTGQSTDLGYFATNKEMPIQLIESIPDADIKYAVKDEFRKAKLSGKINIDEKKGIITLTPKGREFIEKPEFKKAAAENISHTIADSDSQIQTVEFELKGTMNDLNYFNHSDTLDLKDVISSSNKEAVQNVLGNLEKMKESGLISVSGSAVKITEKGKNVLNSELFKAAAKGASSAAASGAADVAVGTVGNVPGIVVVCAKKAIDLTAKAATALLKK